jgi:hypothetical protein
MVILASGAPIAEGAIIVGATALVLRAMGLGRILDDDQVVAPGITSSGSVRKAASPSEKIPSSA